MTEPWPDPAIKAALDRFSVPALPPGFTGRIVATAMASPSVRAPLASARPHRDTRSGWRRGSRVALGVIGLSLMSAAAAAAGLFGETIRQATRAAPVIGPIIAQVAPARPKPLPPMPLPARIRAAPPVAQPVPQPVAAPLSFEERRASRREMRAERIADRIDARAQRRAAAGLPPRPAGRAERFRALPPEERRALIERVRDIRAERREQRVEWRRRIAERRAELRREAETGPDREGNPGPVR